MAKVVCRENGNMHDFYIIDRNNEYYLFSQKYKAIINKFYCNGVILNKAIRHVEGSESKILHHTMTKLKLHIKYIEKENSVAFLNSTKRKLYS